MNVRFYTHLKISYRNVVHDCPPRQILSNLLGEINYVRLQDINQLGMLTVDFPSKNRQGQETLP